MALLDVVIVLPVYRQITGVRFRDHGSRFWNWNLSESRPVSRVRIGRRDGMFRLFGRRAASPSAEDNESVQRSHRQRPRRRGDQHHFGASQREIALIVEL